MRLIFISILWCGFLPKCVGQKTFKVAISLPPKLDQTKLKIFYDNGREQILVPRNKLDSNFLNVSDQYFSNYASITITYFNNKYSGFGHTFFLTDKASKIEIKSVDTIKSLFDKYSLQNAIDFKSEINEFLEFSKKEQADLNDYWTHHAEEFNIRNSQVVNEYQNKSKKLQQRELDFIRMHGNYYYCFWFFRRSLAQSKLLNTDSLLSVFNNSFPIYLRNCGEGKYILNLLNSRFSIYKGHTAPKFVAVDVNGIDVSLNKFYNKSWVLIVFGASWCVPCMKEIPNINLIRHIYSPKDLQVIYFTLDRDKNSFLKMIKDKKMNWRNVYYNAVITNSYGCSKGIPQIYLIDKSGEVIYNMEEEKDLDLTKLNEILKGSIKQVNPIIK